MKKIIDCIQEEYEYAHEEIMTNGIRDNNVYSYISKSFCNGIVNWLYNKEMYMLCRYRFGEDHMEYEGLTYTDKDISDNPNYKEHLEIIDKINNLTKMQWTNTNFNNFGFKRDDIIVTGETYSSYWAIGFDCDVSDCYVYKISKDNYVSLEEFNEAFVKHIQEQGTYISKIRKPDGGITI